VLRALVDGILKEIQELTSSTAPSLASAVRHIVGTR